MRVLLAFDKFKDSLTAREACEIAAHALRERHRAWTLDLCPLADGGEGFTSILTAAAGGQMITSTVYGPRGGHVQAPIGFVPFATLPETLATRLAPEGGARTSGKLAIVEMAAASGLALLEPNERDVWQTTSFGTGELIRTAGELGAAAVLLGVGGSATNDLGLGALAALGLQFCDARGEAVQPPVPARWSEITHIRGTVAPELPPIRIACDVSNPLLGARGAAAIYGPQKGLRPEDLPRMDHEAARVAMLLCNHFGRSDAMMETPGAGAAGGISFGLMTAARAELLSGFELVSTWLNLEARIAAADLVITGEGRFDESSLNGKGPGAVAARALALNKRVHVFAGTAKADSASAALSLHSISPANMPLEQALPQATTFLARSVRDAFAAGT